MTVGSILLWLLVARMWCKGDRGRESGEGGDGIRGEGAMVVDCSWLWMKFAIFSCHSILSGGLPPSFLAFTVNELGLLFLRQCFFRIKSSTKISVCGTFPESPIWMKVSRYVYLRMTGRDVNMLLWLRVHSGFWIGGEDVTQRHARKSESRKGGDGICWDGAIAVGCEWSLPSFRGTVFYQGVFRLLFLRWLWMKSAFFSCGSVLWPFRLQPRP